MKTTAVAILVTQCVLLTACSEKEEAQVKPAKPETTTQTTTTEIAVKGPDDVFDPESAIIALQYYIDEARRGSAYAQLSVGEAYMDGKIVPVNHIESYAWLATAKRQDIDEATELMDEVWGRMSEEEQNYATALSHYYISNYATATQ